MTVSWVDIPGWVDAESLHWMILGAVAALALVAVLMLRLLRRSVLRLAAVAVLGGLALGLWLQRTDLQDCVQTCSCRLFGQDVSIPADSNPNCT